MWLLLQLAMNDIQPLVYEKYPIAYSITTDIRLKFNIMVTKVGICRFSGLALKLHWFG